MENILCTHENCCECLSQQFRIRVVFTEVQYSLPWCSMILSPKPSRVTSPPSFSQAKGVGSTEEPDGRGPIYEPRQNKMDRVGRAETNTTITQRGCKTLPWSGDLIKMKKIPLFTLSQRGFLYPVGFIEWFDLIYGILGHRSKDFSSLGHCSRAKCPRRCSLR